MIGIQVEGGALRLRFPKLNAEQAEALAFDREVGVSAGAGAGKTTTLAARFVALHHHRLAAGAAADPAAVLVLTFTERAAQEMRERCYRMVGAMAERLEAEAPALEAGGVPAAAVRRLRAGWEGLRDRFGAAAITTFHGFCARVLREFPHESATPPGFTILEEVEADRLVAEAAAAAVDAAVAVAPTDPGGTDLALLLRTFGGRGRLVEEVAGLVRARGEVGEALERHAAGRVTEADLVAAAPVSPEAARAFLVERWRPWARRLLDLVGAEPTPYLRRLAEALRTVDPDAPGVGAYAALIVALDALRGSGGTAKALKHHTAIGKKADRPRWTAGHDAALADLQAELDDWAGWFDQAPALPTAHDRTMLTVLGAVSRLARDAIVRHRGALDAAAAVDFTELQLRVRAAFAGGDASPVVQALRARHRYVMVDEFQDTDAIQWSIVEALGRVPGEPADRLFFVGDVKQAIYGFRGGDVQVFAAAAATVGGEADRHGGRAVGLSRNHRSRPVLIELFNALFASVLGPPAPGRPPWEAPFAPLAAGRPEPGGHVHVALHDVEGAIAGAEAEARAVARHIVGLLAGDGPVDGLADRARHPSPPIAILLQRRTHLWAHEAALRAAGVPFVVLGGLSFWSRPEVTDIVNLLVALVRGDPVARVGALRSPLFDLDDQLLADLAARRQLERFPEADPESLPPAARPAWHRWQDLAARLARAPLSAVVEAAVRGARLAWQQARLAPGGRGLGNLARLQALLDAHEQGGGDRLALVDRLAGAVDREDASAEATPAMDEVRVVISTVHGAKGLEYPVVFLPGLDARPIVRPERRVARRRGPDGWELACQVPDPAGGVDDTAKPGAWNRLQALARQVEEAEARRLFYVACTRARDALYLVGRETDPGRGTVGTWSRWLAEWLAGASPPWLTRETLLADTPLPRWVQARAPLPPPPPDLARRLAPLPAARPVEVPPSSLTLADTDLDAWYAEVVAGLPHLDLQPVDARMKALRAAAVRGEVLHGLLEDDALDDLDRARRRWRAASASAGLDEAAAETGWRQVEAAMAALRADGQVEALFRRTHYRELAVRYHRRRVVLAGRVDLLCRDPADGAWMVVDYKSAREERPADAWRLQLLAYSIAASAVLRAEGEAGVARAAVLHTATGRLERLPDWTDADRAGLDALLDRIEARVAAG